MTRKQKKMLRRILLSAVALITAELLPLSGWSNLLAHLLPYSLVGYDVLRKALLNIKNGQVFDENFLMTIATLGAFGCGDYAEGVAVMLLYQVGELFQSVAVGKSRKSIAALMDIRPESANIERDGTLVEVFPEEVIVGQTIVIKPGERVPLDGTVLEGSSALDTAALTGESLPRPVSPGFEVVSGCINLTGTLRVRVTRPYDQSTVARILELVENSATKKATTERFITRFARYYTPAVVFGALALAVIPSLLTGMWMTWIHRALIFLVVSCPCALVISVPLSFFGGIGGASRQGILVKGSNYLEALADAGIAVFDKTGTLTRGTFSVTEVHPAQGSEEDLLTLAALAEQFSDHPISRSIRAAAPGSLDRSRAGDAEELAGLGIRTMVDDRDVLVGNEKLMAQFHISAPDVDTDGTVVHLAADGVYQGYLIVSDEIKPTTADALKLLKSAGIRKTVMLTGDLPSVGQRVGQFLGLDEIHAGLLPADKVNKVEDLLAQTRPGEKLVFVGDGINDAPVLARADIGVAMGALGSDAAIEAADIVLMDDDLTKLATAVRIARKTCSIVRQNIAFALGVKFLVLGLTVIGRSNMWIAVFADVGVAMIAIFNAGRTLTS